MTEVTALVHTRNSADTLERCLSSLTWCDSIIVADMCSEDATVSIAQAFGATLEFCSPSPWRDSLRNRVAGLVKTPWTFVLDSDEHLAEDAGDILRLTAVNCRTEVDAFALPRRNMFFGRILMNSRWYPDYQVRLFKSGKAKWVDKHHVGAVVQGEVEALPLQGPHIYHDAYKDLSDFALKQMIYAMTDDYSEPLDAGAYLSRSFKTLLDSRGERDMERSLDLVLAWTELYRCLFHWEAKRLDGEPFPEVLKSPISIAFAPEAANSSTPESDVVASVETSCTEESKPLSSLYLRRVGSLLRRFRRRTR